MMMTPKGGVPSFPTFMQKQTSGKNCKKAKNKVVSTFSFPGLMAEKMNGPSSQANEGQIP